MYYMGARWYDQQLGRWISPDTIVPQPGNPQSYNRYSYVNNSPARYRDPSGHALEGGTSTDDPYTTTGEEEYGIKPAMIVLPPTGKGYWKGREGYEVEGIVMHKTAGKLSDDLDWLRNGGEVSAHFLVSKAGTIYQIVPLEDAAWCSGGTKGNESQWTTSRGDTYTSGDVNRTTIGVEVEGASGEAYTSGQKEACSKLVEWLVRRYDIDPEDIVSHAYVTPGNPDGMEFLSELQSSVQADQHRPPVRGPNPSCW